MVKQYQKKEFKKNFVQWAAIQAKLDMVEFRQSFNPGEVWWCSVGVNIGHEYCGKGKLYSRPVLIIAKPSWDTLICLPMTHSRNHGRGTYPLSVLDANSKVVLNQVNTYDSLRLDEMITTISERDLKYIRTLVRSII